MGDESLDGVGMQLDVAFEVPVAQEFGDKLVPAAIGFVHHYFGTPAVGFESDLAGTGKGIEKTAAGQGFAQRGEDGFLDKVGSNAGVALLAVVEGDISTLQSARNDAHRCLKE